jgi:hypothetical protein
VLLRPNAQDLCIYYLYCNYSFISAYVLINLKNRLISTLIFAKIGMAASIVAATFSAKNATTFDDHDDDDKDFYSDSKKTTTKPPSSPSDSCSCNSPNRQYCGIDS